MAQRVELWPVEKLRPYEKNARTHSKQQVDQLAASIVEFGFTNPVLVDSDDGILAGHGRLAAARKLGLEQVPVVVLDHLSPKQRKAYVLADNKLALNAGWDDALLLQELLDVQRDGFDLDLVGFSDEELADLFDDGSDADENPEDPDDQQRLGPLPVPDHLPSANDLDIPDLLDTNQPQELPERYVKWGQIGREAIFPGLVHFYTDDYKFRALWDRPWLIPQGKFVQAIEPNYSTFGKDPAPYHVLSTYYKRWLSRYWQEHGVQIWVDLNVIGRSWDSYLFVGVPDTYLAYATRYQKADLSGENCGIPHLEQTWERILSHVQPRLHDQVRFLVYGGGSRIRELCAERGWLYLQDSNKVLRTSSPGTLNIEP